MKTRERSGGLATFAELSRAMPGFNHPAAGSGVVLELRRNVIVWFGMREAWTDTLIQPREAGKVVLTTASVLLYTVDGMVPRAPVARRLPAGGYATPHWLPCTLHLPSEARR